jgi:hypothetical protein
MGSNLCLRNPILAPRVYLLRLGVEGVLRVVVDLLAEHSLVEVFVVLDFGLGSIFARLVND